MGGINYKRVAKKRGLNKKKRFNCLKSAENFAKKVDGIVYDNTKFENARSKYTVKYFGTSQDRRPIKEDFCPEEGRDFGYSNDFWQ